MICFVYDLGASKWCLYGVENHINIHLDLWIGKERLKIRHGMMKSQYLAAGNSKMCFALSLLDVAIIISQHYHCNNKENYEIYWKQTKYVNKVWIIEHFEHDLLIKYYIVA